MDNPPSKADNLLVLLTASLAGSLVLRWVFDFLFLPCPARKVPLGISLAVLLVAMGVSGFLRGVRRRTILDLFLYAVSITLASLLVYRQVWGETFESMGFLKGYSTAVLVLTVGAHWTLGVKLRDMVASHAKTLSNFDAGIGILLFIAFLRFGVKMEDPRAFQIVGLYLISGLVLLYQKKRQEIQDPSPRKTSLPRTVGTLLLAWVAVLGVAWLAFPLLTESADRMYHAARSLLSPLSPYLIRVLRFLLGFTFARPAEPMAMDSGTSTSLPSSAGEPLWLRAIGKALGWGTMGLLSLVGLGMIVLLIIAATQALLRTRGQGTTFSQALLSLLREWLRGIRSGLARGRRILQRFPFTELDLVTQRHWLETRRALKSLYRFGSLFGIRRSPSETINRYVQRIAVRFPRLSIACESIQRWAELLSYAPLDKQKPPFSGPQSLAHLRSARRSLWVPLNWLRWQTSAKSHGKGAFPPKGGSPLP